MTKAEQKKKLLLHEPGDAADWQGCPDFSTCVTLHRGVKAIEIPKPERQYSSRAVVLLSGGMDSTTLAYDLAAQGWALTLVSVDYGQKHREKELDAAQRYAAFGGSEHVVVSYPELGALLGSALTSTDIDVPDGHYTDDSMAATVVPNRNAILISLAWGIAVSVDASLVATAVHAGDHPIYPDCRPEFIEALGAALKLGTAGLAKESLTLAAPYVEISKTEIARRGDHLGVNWANTWSCYKGGELHCGMCGTCVERHEAFTDAGLEDPTDYYATGEMS